LFPACPSCESTAWHAQIEERLDPLYNAGLRLLRTQAWDQAIEKFTAILQIYPDYKDVSERIQKAQQAQFQQELSHLYHEGMTDLREQRWRRAAWKFEQVLRLDPNYRDASVRLQEAHRGRVQEKLSRSYGQGMEYLSDQNWSRAMKKFEEILSVDPDYRDASARSDEAYRGRFAISGVLPRDIDVEQSFSEFGALPTQYATRVIVEFCQQKNRWDDFRFNAINEFHKNLQNEHSRDDFSFGELIKKKFIRKKVGFLGFKYRVTGKFVDALKK
jgi:outer membrane protein assembly factor BamD (BamD/ComL family)